VPAKKCFIISPIGDEQSEIRKEADALLWVAKSALERYDFHVIRVDQIARSTIITNEIIQLLQEAELCLIVLTGENANVFYEAGRRHETGRPFIQLIRRGDTIPFDVAGIRTIIYDDIQSVPSAAKVAAQIQAFIEEFEKTGYGASGTGVSMSTIASALDRIERKVGQLMIGGGSTGPSHARSPDSDFDLGLGMVRNPREAFMKAVAQGDVRTAGSLLPRLEKLLGPSAELLACAGFLSVQGDEAALELAYRVLTEHLDQIKGQGDDALKTGISGVVQFYVTTDRELEGVQRCEPVIRRIAQLPEIGKGVKAFALNQLQMLMFGAKRYQEALSLVEEALALEPSTLAYVYNASLIYEKVGLTQKAVEMVDRYMAMPEDGDPNPSHLSHAVETYVAAGRIDEARSAFGKLRQVDPGKAKLLVLDADMRKKLGL